MHEDGIGMARTFELEFEGRAAAATGLQSGFFAAVDAAARTRLRTPDSAPACARATDAAPVRLAHTDGDSIGILDGRVRRTGDRAAVRSTRSRRRPRLPGRQRVLRRQHRRHRPDGRRRPGTCARAPSRPAIATCCPTSACPRRRFLDGTTVADLPRPVEVVATDGISLARSARWSRHDRRRSAHRRHRRAAQRRQEHAVQPHRRRAGRRSSRTAPA